MNKQTKKQQAALDITDPFHHEPLLEVVEGTLEPETADSLIVCDGASVGRRHAIGDALLVIGRGADCTVHLDDDRVSVRHAEVSRGRLRDLRSSTGTMVNDRNIDEIELRDGDIIQIGATVFRYAKAPVVVAAPSLALAPRLHAREREQPTQPLARYQPEQQRVAPSWQSTTPAMGTWQDGFSAGAQVHARGRARDVDEDMSFAQMVGQLRKLIAFFWPYRVAIVALTIVGCAAGGASGFLLPPRASALFDLRLHSQASANPLERSASSSVEFFRSAETTFRSTGMIERTLARMGEKGATAERLETVQAGLRFESTGSEPNAQTYAGSYRGATDAWSLEFLSNHVETYLEAEIEKTLKIIRAQIDFLQAQLDKTSTDLRATEEKLLAFKTANIDGLPDQARQYYDYQFALQKKESALAAEVSRFDAEASVGQRRLQVEEPMVESRVMATRPYQMAIVDVNRQLAEARANGLADAHPDVRQLQAKLVELKQLAGDAERGSDDTQVERSRNPIYDDASDRVHHARASAAATRQEKVRLHEDQARIKSIVDKLPALEAEYADLTRSYEATKTLHTRIFEQHKRAQLQYEIEKASASARFEIISAPRLEFVSPMTTMQRRAGAAGVVGLLLGLAIAVLGQVRRLFAATRSASA